MIEKLREYDHAAITGRAIGLLAEAFGGGGDFEEGSEGSAQDLHDKISGLTEESVMKQKEELAAINQKIIKRHLKLDQSMDGTELHDLIQILIKSKKEYKSTENADDPEQANTEEQKSMPRTALIDVKLYCLKILHHIYQQKWINAKPPPSLLTYTDKLSTAYWNKLKEQRGEQVPEKGSRTDLLQKKD